MIFWEHFKSFLLTHLVNGNLFYSIGPLPETDKEKYWYNKALQDCLKDVKRFEYDIERHYSKKYKSLTDCLQSNGIRTYYDERTNTTHICKP